MLFIVTMSLVSASDEVNNETIIADGIVGTSLVADGVQIANDVNVDEIGNIYYTNSIYSSSDYWLIHIHVNDSYNPLTKKWTE